MKKEKRETWIVIVGVIEGNKEGGQAVMKEYIKKKEAVTRRVACWEVCEEIWKGATALNQIQPIYGVVGLSEEEFAKLEAQLAEARKKQQQAADSSLTDVSSPSDTKAGATTEQPLNKQMEVQDNAVAPTGPQTTEASDGNV